jgi:anti-anti-sigma factor
MGDGRGADMGADWTREGDVLIVRPRGRLSLREGQEMLAAIFEDVAPVPDGVVVDLSGVSDMSSWGFALVCGLARKLASEKKQLRIAGPTPFVRKYLELFTGMKQPMSFFSSKEEALAEARISSRPAGAARSSADPLSSTRSGLTSARELGRDSAPPLPAAVKKDTGRPN